VPRVYVADAAAAAAAAADPALMPPAALRAPPTLAAAARPPTNTGARHRPKVELHLLTPSLSPSLQPSSLTLKHTHSLTLPSPFCPPSLPSPSHPPLLSPPLPLTPPVALQCSGPESCPECKGRGVYRRGCWNGALMWSAVVVLLLGEGTTGSELLRQCLGSERQDPTELPLE